MNTLHNNSLLLTSLLFLFSLNLQAELKTWDDDTGSSNWHHAANWDPNGVPQGGDEVLIPNGEVFVFDDATGILSIIVGTNAKLEIDENVLLSIKSAGSSTSTGMDILPMGELEVNGRLVVVNGSTTALRVRGAVKNNGSIELIPTNATSSCLLINSFASFSNRSTGQLIIDGKETTAEGITSFGTCSNQGMIQINGVTQTAISNNFDIFDNFIGRIDIANEGMSGTDAIRNYNTFINGSCSFIFIHQDKRIGDAMNATTSLENDGVIHSFSTQTNIVNNEEGIIYNPTGGNFPLAGGTLLTTRPTILTWKNCDPTDENDNAWFNERNWDTGFIPDTDSDVIIPIVFISFPKANKRTRDGQQKLGGTYPILTDGELVQVRSVAVDGTMTVQEGATVRINSQQEKNHSLTVSGSFSNSGLLHIQHAIQTGLRVVDVAASFVNEATGNIHIYNINHGDGIHVEQIDISKQPAQQKSEAGGSVFISNRGLITIGELGTVQGHGIYNGGGTFGVAQLSNRETGEIRIVQIGGEGIFNVQTNSWFGNFGQLDIVAVGRNGVLNYGEFRNLMTAGSKQKIAGGSTPFGKIHISQTGLSGIPNEGHGIANYHEMENTESTIFIANTTNHGVLNANGAIFNNFDEIIIRSDMVDLTIQNPGEEAIVNLGGMDNGSILIDGGNFVNESTGFFINVPCGMLRFLSNHGIVNTGNFLNSGIIIENSSSNSNINENNGIVYNLNGGSFSITNNPNEGILTTDINTVYWTGCQQIDITGNKEWEQNFNWSTHSLPTRDTHVIIPTQPLITVESLSKQKVPLNNLKQLGLATSPTVTALGAMARSVSIEPIDKNFHAQLGINPCASLSIAEGLINEGNLNIFGLLRIGTTYHGSGNYTIDNNIGFIEQDSQTFPECAITPDRCFDQSVSDIQFITDYNNDGDALCQGDLAELNNFIAVTGHLTLYLEGALINNKTGGATMSTALHTLLPTQQPFNQAPWNYNGLEDVTAIGGIPNTAVDWVLVELYTTSTNPILVEQKAALLHQNGQLLNPLTALEGVIFNNLNNGGKYNVVIRPRNHLAVVSSEPAPVAANQFSYDFSTSEGRAKGEGQLVSTSSGVWALQAGDINSDGVISVADYNFLIDELGQSGGVFDSDLDMDGLVETDDFNLYQSNSSKIGVAFVRY